MSETSTRGVVSVLDPIEATRLDLVGDHAARFAALRAEKQRRLRDDGDPTPTLSPAEMDRMIDGREPPPDDRPTSCPSCGEPYGEGRLLRRCYVCYPTHIQRVAAARAAGEPPPAPKPKPEKPRRRSDADGLFPATRRVLEAFEALAPGGCRPVRYEEVCDRTGLKTIGAVWKRVVVIRAAGLWNAGWEMGQGRTRKAPKASEPGTPMAPEPVPADTPAGRSLAAHRTKHRVAADERRLRERAADQAVPVACEVSAPASAFSPLSSPMPPPEGWRALAIRDLELAGRVLELLPADRVAARRVIELLGRAVG